MVELKLFFWAAIKPQKIDIQGDLLKRRYRVSINVIVYVESLSSVGVDQGTVPPNVPLASLHLQHLSKVVWKYTMV